MGTGTTYDYTAVVTAVKNGDMDAFETLYNKSIPAFRKQVMKYLKNEADVEDVLQEVYIRIFNSITTLEDPARFLPWGLRICTNLSINRIRAMHEKKNDFDLMPNTSDEDTMGLEDVTVESYRTEFNPEASMDEKETARLMKEIVDGLPEIQRLCIMGWQEKITAKELASELGISENSVYVSINQGKKKIKAKVLELEKQGTKLYGMAPLTFFLWIMDIYDASFVPAKPAFAGVSSFAEIAARIRGSISAPDGTGSTGTGHGIISQMSQQGEAGTGTGHILQGQEIGNPSSSAAGGNSMDAQGTHMGTSSAASSSGSAAAGKEQAAAKAAAGAVKGGAAKGTAGVISKVVVTRIIIAVVIVSVVIGGITVFRRVTKTTKEETVTETTTTTSESHDEDPKTDDPAEFLKGLGLEYIGNREVEGQWINESGDYTPHIDATVPLTGCLSYREIDLDNDDKEELLTVNLSIDDVKNEYGLNKFYGITINVYEKENNGWKFSSDYKYGSPYNGVYFDYIPSTRVDIFIKDNIIYIEHDCLAGYIHEGEWILSGIMYNGTELVKAYIDNPNDKSVPITYSNGYSSSGTFWFNGEDFFFSYSLNPDEIRNLCGNSDEANGLLEELELFLSLDFDIDHIGESVDDCIIAQDKSLDAICRINGTVYDEESLYYEEHEAGVPYGRFKLQYIDFSNESEIEQVKSTNLDEPKTQEEKTSGFILPSSDKEYIDEAIVAALSKDDLRLARNEIYARHGRIFNSEDLQAYFDAKDWYSGTVSPEEFDTQQDTILNEYEKKNIELIQRYEQ